MVKFSLIKIILIWIICINFLIDDNRYVETLNDIEYGVKFSQEDNSSLDDNNIKEDNTLISSSSLYDERSNRSSNLKTYENLVSNGGIDRSPKKGKLTLEDIEGPSISQDFESLIDSSVHVRVKRDNNLLFRDKDEIVGDGKEIFSLKNGEEISVNDIEKLPKRSAAALLIRRKRFDRDNYYFPTRKLLIPKRNIRKVGERIVRGGRKNNRGKSRKHKHRKKPKKKKKKNGSKHNKKPSKLSTRDDFNSMENLKKLRRKSYGLLVGGKPEIEKRDIAEYRNREGENIFRVKRNEDLLLEKSAIDTNNRNGKFCQKDGIKVDDLNYYDEVKEEDRKRFKRRDRFNKVINSLNPRIKIVKRILAEKSVKDIKNLLGQLTGKVNELQGFYLVEKNEDGIIENQRFKRGKKKIERCVDNDSKNLTKPIICQDKNCGLKSKLETDISDLVEEENKSNKSHRDERKISNDEKKITDYNKNYSVLKNNRRKRKSRKKWDRWTDWSSCSVTCGKGRQIRWRHCVHDCTLAETEMEEKTCQLPACGPGKFLGIF